MYYIYKCIYLQYIHVFTSHLNVSTPCIIFFLLWFRRSVFVDRFYGLRNSWKSWSGGGYGSKSFTPESMRGIPKITYLPESSVHAATSLKESPSGSMQTPRSHEDRNVKQNSGEINFWHLTWLLPSLKLRVRPWKLGIVTRLPFSGQFRPIFQGRWFAVRFRGLVTSNIPSGI